MNIIDKIYDDTKNGVPNYSFSMTDGRRLYYSGFQMNPMPVTGDAINFTIVSTKTSANGNQYTTIKDVEVIKNPDGHNDAPQQLSNNVVITPPCKTPVLGSPTKFAWCGAIESVSVSTAISPDKSASINQLSNSSSFEIKW